VTVVRETTWLLGAGASRDAGVPLAAELFDQLKGASGQVELNATYDYVAAGAIMRAARLSLVGNWRRPNIEDVANTLDELIRRDSSDLGPFVGAWHSWLNDVDPLGEPSLKVTEQVGATLQRVIAGVNPRNGEGANIDWTAEAKRLVELLQAPRHPGEILSRLRLWLSQAVRDRMTGPYGDVSYLEPLARTRVGTSHVCMGATLNYDLCVEQAFESAGYRVCDGLGHWLSHEVMDVKHSAAHIYKPHGSILWRSVDEDTFSFWSAQEDGEPGIIFGGRNKLTAHGPFLDSLLTWRAGLEKCRNLLVIGYSFGDDHVNALIANWLRIGKDSKRIIVIDPGFSKSGTGFAGILHRNSNEARDPDMDSRGRLILPSHRSVHIMRRSATEGIPKALALLENM
jgi:hypothetical protein